MADYFETLYANALLDGSVTGGANATGTPDGTVTTNSGGVDWTGRWAMSDPTFSVLSGTQTIVIHARSSGTSNPGSMTVELYQAGALVATLVTGQVLTNAIATYTYTFSGASISNPAVVEIRISGTQSGGNPQTRQTAQIDAIEWQSVQVLEATLEDEAADANADDAILTEVQRVGAQEDDITDGGWASAGPFTPDVNYSDAEWVEPYYTAVELGIIADDELEDTSAFAELIAGARNVLADKADDAVPDDTLLTARADLWAHVEQDAVANADLLTGVKAAVDDVEEVASADPELVAAVLGAATDLESVSGADDTVLTEDQTSLQGEEYTEEVDREDTILQQRAMFVQDVEEVATSDVAVTNQRLDAAGDEQELVPAYGEVSFEEPFYRQDILESTPVEAAPVSTQVAGTTELEDYAAPVAEVDTQRLDAAVEIDEETLAEGYASEVQADDIEEVIEAAAGVPVDPLQEDVTEWVFGRDRVANTYADELEEVQAVADSLTAKLHMDIAVDIDALVELVNESRTNRQSLVETATVEALYDTRWATSQTVENEAYAGGSVLSTTAATSANIIEDVSATAERLLARLLLTQHVDVDANGSADVAGAAWFKSHSFIEEAGADDAVLTEVIRRPTKDDVAEDASADVAVETSHLAAIAAWSEDVLAESELLGNESGEAWVFNSRTLAFSRYVGFEASQATTVDHEPVAAGARGLMRYAETFAEGYVKTGLSDYGSPQIKRMRHAYITAASRAPIQLSTLQGIGDVLQSTTYSVATLDSAIPYTHRIDLARGDRGQFWAFELRAPAGYRTTLLNLRVQPLLTSRRI